MADVLKGNELQEKTASIPDWEGVNDEKIVRTFEFDDFKGALDFVNRVGELAEDANHHPDIAFGWGKAEITFTSHDAGGVTKSDIEMAEKVDAL